MEIIRARLGDHVNLAARLRPVFGIIQSAVDAVFADCVLRDMQTGLRFLGLLLNASGIDAVKLKIVIVSGATREANGSLIAAAVVLRERGEKSETCPIAPVVWEICDLIGADNGRSFGRTPFHRHRCCSDLDLSGNSANRQLNI